jgi:hypothetical protein
MKLFWFVLLFPILSFGLEVDEKLTIRLLKISESKKTVMVNRGTEDGIVEGDHAKFIVTAGIVARSVCVKVSPTRSVWSIYRLVNADFILNDSVMTLKITPPVKITKDETQAIVQEDTPSNVSGDPANLGIPLADGAQDLNLASEKMSAADLKALEESQIPLSIVEKNLEIYGLINISGLSSNSKTNVGDQSFNSSQSFHQIGLGVEYYPKKEREWFSNISLLGEFTIQKQDSQAYNGAGITNDVNEFSVGLNWHPTKAPSMVSEFIPYLHTSVNFGVVRSTYKAGTNTGTPELSSSGKTSGFSIGGGYKFFTHKGFGARFIADYYVRSEVYQEDDLANVHNKKVGGPRLLLALSYRF